jgi:hypothetical protein
MRLQTDRKIEIVRLVKIGEHQYAEAPDDQDPSKLEDAVIESREFAPEIDVMPGDLLLVKVLE